MSEETLFHEALAKPVAERGAFLDAACVGQPELRAAVEALLAAHAASGNLLDQPAVDPNLTGDYTPPPVENTGVHVAHDAQPRYVIAGRYTLEQRIGEGGMGEVWVAQQTKPVKRKVALKLIKAGMDSKAVLQRFEAERQALALMDHPHIAKVLDGGVTENRHPFFVMELVNGLPLNKFCDEAKLPPQQRLELFVSICQAVQHAHQKGIVHRDLKPANILVTLIDGQPVPKVIDFGVAKAISSKLTDESLSTQFGAVVGTLEYMAPEQAGYSGEDIDTRADIYSLGVILYELLTGLRPIDSKRLKKAALSEMIRIIKEEEPSKPSTRLSTDESLPSLAALRQTEPKKLMALLRGELDWVVMKCLEKSRDHRYETANGLARDIQRYLADEPVEARPPSFGYRAGKFLRRHQGQVIAASLVLVTLLSGIVGTTLGLIEANRSAEAERQAKHREIERAEGEKAAKLDAQQKELLAVAAAAKERAARLEEERQRKYAQAIAAFVKDDFLALTSLEGQLRFGGEGLDRTATLMDLLNRAAAKLKERKNLDPRIEAELCWIVGVNYRAADEPAKGIPFLERAVQLRRQALGAEHSDTINAMSSLSVAYTRDGKIDLAVPLAEEVLRVRKAGLPPGHADTLDAMHNLAETYLEAGAVAKGVSLQEEAFKVRKANLGSHHPATLTSMGNLAEAYRVAGRIDKALPLYEETIRLRKAHQGADHPSTLVSMANLASFYQQVGKFDLAIPIHEESLKLVKVKFGPDHPNTLRSMGRLGDCYRAVNKYDLAQPLLEAAFEGMKAKLGPDHPNTRAAMSNLGLWYKESGKPELAVPLLEKSFALTLAKYGPDHRETNAGRFNLARAYQLVGKVEKALPLLEKALELDRAQLGSEHPETVNSIAGLAVAYVEAKQGEKVVPLMKESLAAKRKRLPPGGTEIAGWLAGGATMLTKVGQYAEAEALLRECLAIREKKEPDAWTTFTTQSMLGGALVGQKKYAEAEPLLIKGYEGMKQREKSIPPPGKVRLTEALERLVQLYEATGKEDEAAKWRKEWEAIKAAQPKSENKP